MQPVTETGFFPKKQPITNDQRTAILERNKAYWNKPNMKVSLNLCANCFRAITIVEGVETPKHCEKCQKIDTKTSEVFCEEKFTQSNFLPYLLIAGLFGILIIGILANFNTAEKPKAGANQVLRP